MANIQRPRFTLSGNKPTGGDNYQLTAWPVDAEVDFEAPAGPDTFKAFRACFQMAMEYQTQFLGTGLVTSTPTLSIEWVPR